MSADRTAAARASMVEQLTRDGWLRTPAWQDAFRAVPRHLFLPRFFRLAPDRRRHEAIDRDHPDWPALIYANTVLTTQLDSDDTRWQSARDNGPVEGTATSSSTQPSLMASTLEALEIHDGQRVLEVGTGTGYNSGLLCHRLGDELVTSVEYDPTVAKHARHALEETGYHPTLVTGDGVEGHPAGAPYDRLIATYSVPAIPPAWLHQVRPGGVLVVSLYRDLGVGLMLRLVVDDGTAHGHLLPDCAYFMPTRTHTDLDTDTLLRTASKQPTETVRSSTLPAPISDTASGWTALAGLLLPEVARLDISRSDGAVQWLVHPDGSWAYYQSTDHQVEQGGPRRLWNEVEAAYDRWQQLDQPARERFGLTVLADGTQRIWLDHDKNVVTS
ncbi:MAG: ATP-grasp peptide maturase system methyltransferase [Sciscionella sp.]